MPDADDPHPREVEVVRLAPCPVAPLALPPARPLVPLPPLSTIPPHSRVDEPVHRCSSTTSSYHAHHTQFTTHATHTHTHAYTSVPSCYPLHFCDSRVINGSFIRAVCITQPSVSLPFVLPSAYWNSTVHIICPRHSTLIHWTPP